MKIDFPTTYVDLYDEKSAILGKETSLLLGMVRFTEVCQEKSLSFKLNVFSVNSTPVFCTTAGKLK